MLKEVRDQVLVGFGIVGGALTIVDYLSDFMTVVDWGDWLLGNWRVYFRGFWTFISSILGVGSQQ
jgi:hypothetical protein